MRYFKHNDQVVKCFIENALERVCDVIMFSEEVHIKKEAKDILRFILEMHLIRDNTSLGYFNLIFTEF